MFVMQDYCERSACDGECTPNPLLLKTQGAACIYFAFGLGLRARMECLVYGVCEVVSQYRMSE